ncbi:MAG: hypothetical protein IPP85_02015 [Propionivibrio sp.]|nr:hypothetical protein [Propionivibrio sp.]
MRGRQIVAAEDPEIALPDHPLGNESAGRAVRADGAEGGAEFMVHQHREGTVAIVVGAQTVRDADHLVAVVCGIADADDRGDVPTGGGRCHIGGLRTAGALSRLGRGAQAGQCASNEY